MTVGKVYICVAIRAGFVLTAKAGIVKGWGRRGQKQLCESVPDIWVTYKQLCALLSLWEDLPEDLKNLFTSLLRCASYKNAWQWQVQDGGGIMTITRMVAR